MERWTLRTVIDGQLYNHRLQHTTTNFVIGSWLNCSGLLRTSCEGLGIRSCGHFVTIGE